MSRKRETSTHVVLVTPVKALHAFSNLDQKQKKIHFSPPIHHHSGNHAELQAGLLEYPRETTVSVAAHFSATMSVGEQVLPLVMVSSTADAHGNAGPI